MLPPSGWPGQHGWGCWPATAGPPSRRVGDIRGLQGPASGSRALGLETPPPAGPCTLEAMPEGDWGWEGIQGGVRPVLGRARHTHTHPPPQTAWGCAGSTSSGKRRRASRCPRRPPSSSCRCVWPPWSAGLSQAPRAPPASRRHCRGGCALGAGNRRGPDTAAGSLSRRPPRPSL